MTEQQASRTLVKSPPELWAECTDAASLGRHLGQLGEIRITRLEPETTVVWEGEEVSGTVKLEPSGWGTRVTLTLESDEEPPPQEPEPKPAPSPLPPAAVGRPRRGLLGRLLAAVAKPERPPHQVRTELPAAPEPPADAEPPPSPESPPSPVLLAALDSLGSAHHRPFSRA
jgi:hypothetical protein